MSSGKMAPMTPGSMPDGSSTTNSSDGMMSMHMSFYWGKDAIIFFSGWPEKHLGMYMLALTLVFLLALAIEVLSVSPTLKRPGTNPIVAALTQTAVYALRMGFAYLVMLSVMSYNLGIFIVTVAGHAVGFFLVRSRALATANDASKV